MCDENRDTQLMSADCEMNDEEGEKDMNKTTQKFLHILAQFLEGEVRIIKYNNKTRYIEKNASLSLLCGDYVSIIVDGTSVSTFLCT